MKKVKLIKKALLPAVIAVFCSLVALTSVSYAWFTLGNSASIEGIDVNVQAEDGLQISHDGYTWKSLLDVESLKQFAGNEFDLPTKGVLPMSSAGNVNEEGKLEIFDGVYENDKLTSTVPTGNTTNYISFDLYVKLNKATELFLSNTSTVELKDEDEINTHTAVRVAFVNLGTDTDGTNEEGKLTYEFDAENNTKATIWEPNSTLTREGKTQTKQGYKGVNAAAEDFNPASENVETVTTKDFDNETDEISLFGELEAGVTRIRVYIWLEGQDVDCTNDISGNEFVVNLAFHYNKGPVEE